MTWRAAMHRRRKARKELPALARASEGPTSVGIPPNLTAGVSPQVAPAVFLPPPRELAHGEWPPKEEIAALQAAGLNDGEIAKRYQRSHMWTFHLRQRYGLPAGGMPKVTADEVNALVAQGLTDRQIGARYGESKNWGENQRRRYGIAPAHPRTKRIEPEPPVVVADSYATFFAEHGLYPSFTDRQIGNYEEAWAIAHPRRAPAVVDVAPILYGDPTPGRARA